MTDSTPAHLEQRAAAMAGPALLSLRGVGLTMGTRTLLRDLDLDLAAGERLAVVGANGTGKSTLLSVLAGLSEPQAGRVERPADPPGMLFQDGAFWPHMTVAAHLAFVDRHHDPAWRARLIEAFALDNLVASRPEALSGGERLRLGLARALAGKPRWVLLDEPLAQLDRELAVAVREMLPELVDELGAAVVIVSHDADDVLLFGDRVLALTGDGGWWLGDARQALAEPPTAALAALSEHGSVLTTTVGADGRAHFGLGLALEQLDPGREVSAFLDQADVRFAVGDAHALPGSYLAPDRRGGSWVRVDGHLLRCGEARSGLRRGDPVSLHIDGSPRLLLGRRPT